MIKQRYGSELRNKTLASIKPEISQALESLLEELKSSNEARIMRTNMFPSNKNHRNNNRQNFKKKVCCLCQAANRPGFDNHYLSSCKFLPESDRRFMSSSKIRQIETIEDENENNFPDYENTSHYDENQNMNYHYNEQQDPFLDHHIQNPINRRITTRPSPHLKCFYQHFPVTVCIDTGAESNLISERFAKYSHIPILPTQQGANQADGKTPLKAVGEAQLSITHGPHSFNLDGLIIRGLSSDIIVGEPFLELNDIGVRSARK